MANVTCKLAGCNNQITEANMTMIVIEELSTSLSGWHCCRTHAIVDALMTVYDADKIALNKALKQFAKMELTPVKDLTTNLNVTAISPADTVANTPVTAATVSLKVATEGQFDDILAEDTPEEDTPNEGVDQEIAPPIQDFGLTLVDTATAAVDNNEIGADAVSVAVETPKTKQEIYLENATSMAKSVSEFIEELKKVDGFVYEMQIIQSTYVYGGMEFASQVFSFYRSDPYFTFNISYGYDFVCLSFSNASKNAVFKNLQALFDQKESSAALVFNQISQADIDAQVIASNNQML